MPPPGPDLPKAAPDAKEFSTIPPTVAKAVAGSVGRFRKGAWIVVCGVGVFLLVDNVPYQIERLLGRKGKTPAGETAKDRALRARSDAVNINRTILPSLPNVELQTITDSQILARVHALLADDTISPGEVFDAMRLEEEGKLFPLQRRLGVIGNDESTKPEAYKRRQPLLAKAADQLIADLKRDQAVNGQHAMRWKEWAALLNAAGHTKNDEEKATQACEQIRSWLLAHLPFSADLVTMFLKEAGYEVTEKARQRLAESERGLLRQFRTERFKLHGQARALKHIMTTVDGFPSFHRTLTQKMRQHGISIGDADEKQQTMDARHRHIRQAIEDLAKTMTVMELRYQAIYHPTRFAEPARKAIEAYFGKGNEPKKGQTKRILVDRQITQLNLLSARVNNSHPDWERAEFLLRELANTVQPDGKERGDQRKLAGDLTEFLARIEKSTDPKTQAVRAILSRLAAQRPLTLEHLQTAYDEMKKDQELPFAEETFDLIASWCEAHRQSFHDPKSLEDDAVRKRYDESRSVLNQGIVAMMEDVLRLRNLLDQARSGFGAVEMRLQPESRDTGVAVTDPYVAGDFEKDQVALAKELSAGSVTVLKELNREFLTGDTARDAALKTVKVLRKILHVFDVLRGQKGQTTEQTLSYKKITEMYDPKPIERLMHTYESLIVLMDDPRTASVGTIAQDRESTPDDRIEEEIAKLIGEELTPERVKTMLDGLAPAQRLALRTALERKRWQQMRSVSDEVHAYLLMLQGMSFETSGVVGDLSRSGDWSWLRFAAGLCMLLGGTKGLLRVRRDRRRTYDAALAGGQETADAILEKIGTPDERPALHALELLNPDFLAGRVSGLARKCSKLDLSDRKDRNAKKVAAFRASVESVIDECEKAHTMLQKMRLHMNEDAQERVNEEVAPNVDKLSLSVATALETIDRQSENAHQEPARRALAALYVTLERLMASIQRFGNQPIATPTLDEIDPLTSDAHSVLRLASQETVQIEAADVPGIREELARRKAERGTPPPSPEVTA